MSRKDIFGWSYPPGCSGPPEPNDEDYKAATEDYEAEIKEEYEEPVNEIPYERPVTVRCQECNTWYQETECKFENIEEDLYGRDVLTFTCPKGHASKSLRRG